MEEARTFSAAVLNGSGDASGPTHIALQPSSRHPMVCAPRRGVSVEPTVENAVQGVSRQTNLACRQERPGASATLGIAVSKSPHIGPRSADATTLPGATRILFSVLVALAAFTPAGCQVYDESLLVQSSLGKDDSKPTVSPFDDPTTPSSAPSESEPAPEANDVKVPSPMGDDASTVEPVKHGLELNDAEPPAAQTTTADASSPSQPAPSTSETDQPVSAGGAAGTTPEPTASDAGVPSGSGGSEPAPRGAGGSVNSGGTGGGSSGSGGSGGDAGVAPPLPMDTAVWSFTSDADGWVAGVSSPTSLGTATTLSFDDTQGSPNPGSLQVVAPFSGSGQMLAVQAPIETVDLRGVTVTAEVMLSSGLSSDAGNPSRIKLFAKSGSAYAFASGPDFPLDSTSEWITVTFDLDSPSYIDPSGEFDASDIREIGFEINSGSGSSVSEATLYIDSVDY